MPDKVHNVHKSGEIVRGQQAELFGAGCCPLVQRGNEKSRRPVFSDRSEDGFIVRLGRELRASLVPTFDPNINLEDTGKLL